MFSIGDIVKLDQDKLMRDNTRSDPELTFTILGFIKDKDYTQYGINAYSRYGEHIGNIIYKDLSIENMLYINEDKLIAVNVLPENRTDTAFDIDDNVKLCQEWLKTRGYISDPSLIFRIMRVYKTKYIEDYTLNAKVKNREIVVNDRTLMGSIVPRECLVLAEATCRNSVEELL